MARQLPAHIKRDRSACTRSFRTLFGGIFAFSFTRSRAGAPKGVSPASKRARSPAARSLPRRSSLPRLLGWQQWSGLCVCPGPSYPPSRAQVDKTTRVAATLPVRSCRARRRARGARREHTRLCERTREGGTRLWCCPGPVYALWVAPGGDLGRDRGVRAKAVTLGRGAPLAADVVSRSVARRAIH